MSRVLSLYLPTWPTDRLRRRAGTTAPPRDQALVLKTKVGSKRVIYAVDDLARYQKLYPGMSVAKAQVLVPDLLVFDAEPAADAEGLEKLAIWALKHYSPIVAADPPDGLVLDVTGAAHLFGGEDGLLADIRRRLAEAGIEARVALADTWGAAHALARYRGKETLIVPPGKAGEAITALPVAGLRLPADLVEELLLLGIETIGELAAKPRAPLARRYGPQLFRRVDQAFGRLAEPIQPVDCPELIVVSRIFAEPIGAPETLEKYTRRLVAQMCDKLEEAGLGVRRLDLHFVRVDNRIEAISVATAKPVRDVKRLSKLLVDKIELVEPGFGIDKMQIIAVQAEPLVRTQVGATFAEPPRADVEDLWDTLANRYGGERLFRAVSVASDIPERSVKRLPPTSTEVGSKRNAAFRRPTRLLRRPETVQAIAVLPDQPPRTITWRNQRYQVVAADGPERVKGEWWRSAVEMGSVRDYYILEVESGERFWVFRQGDGQHGETGSLNWFLHGKFE
jgi:protein ImuB